MTITDSMNLPTRTQIDSRRVDHLESAAEEWTRRAEAWERAYSAVVREVSQPGGTSWEGAAAQAAAQRVITDRRTVLHAADSLHDVAAIARCGATDIRVAQALAQNRIYSAQRADFSIQEDLSIIDNGLSSSSDREREAVAMRYAEKIWHAAQALDTTDRTVTGGPYGFDSPIDVSGVG